MSFVSAVSKSDRGDISTSVFTDLPSALMILSKYDNKFLSTYSPFFNLLTRDFRNLSTFSKRESNCFGVIFSFKYHCLNCSAKYSEKLSATFVENTLSPTSIFSDVIASLSESDFESSP